MRTILSGILFLLSLTVAAQRECVTSEYINIQKVHHPFLHQKFLEIETFIQQDALKPQTMQDDNNIVNSLNVYKIPVVVHVLYNTPDQNITDAQVISQINALNRDFRRLNADSSLTPSRFRSIAADVQIEFVLATADPSGRATRGIVRKYTDQTVFKTDDRIKFSSQGGSDAWNTKNYLNIWVGKFQSVMGYSTIPGSPEETDGIVVSTQAFGTFNTVSPYNMGRTAVHEAGHWLGLKHIWGDQYCGDDGVGDTPVQGNFTPGCPTTFRSSCSNGEMGDMYMNYMDYTSDACVNLFTLGQKQRMRAMFSAGGPRNSLLYSKGLSQPWNHTAAEPEDIITEAPVKLFPNPARTEITITMNSEWMGAKLGIADISGRILEVLTLTSTEQRINISRLKPGVYFLTGEKDGSLLRKKFIRF
jgi:hypothetical protein